MYASTIALMVFCAASAKCEFSGTCRSRSMVAPSVRISTLTHNNNSKLAKSTLPFELSIGDLRDFSLVMGKISSAAKVTILAEGIPLRKVLTEPEAAAIEKALSDASDASVLNSVAVIARGYDYDAIQDGRGYTLVKRYTDPVDLPLVTYEEVVASLRSILQVTEAFAPALPVSGSDTSSFDFFGSLTKEQQSAARSTSGVDLTLAELSTDQRYLALASARQVILDSKTRSIRLALEHLVEINREDVRILWTRYSGAQVFAYEGPFGPGGARLDYPMDAGLFCSVTAAADRPPDALLRQIAPPPQVSPIVLSAATSNGEELLGNQYDPTAPTSLDQTLAHGMLSDKISATTTLQLLANDLTTKSSGLKIIVDPSVAAKPVSVFGRSFVSGAELIRLAAHIYGLRLATDDNRTLSISTPTPRPVTGYPDVQAELARIVPPSLTRSLDSQASRIAGMLADIPVPADFSDASKKRSRSRMKSERGPARCNLHTNAGTTLPTADSLC